MCNSGGEMKFASEVAVKAFFIGWQKQRLSSRPLCRGGEILGRQTFLISANGHCYGWRVLEAQRLVCPSRARPRRESSPGSIMSHQGGGCRSLEHCYVNMITAVWIQVRILLVCSCLLFEDQLFPQQQIKKEFPSLLC